MIPLKLITLSLAIVVGMAASETFESAGHGIEYAGKAISNTADE